MKLDIEVTSDIVCPWCYVGKRRLDKAMATFTKNVPVTVTWKPYQLNPGLPPEGVDRRAYMEEKFGPARVEEMNRHLSELGKEEGINFHFDKISRSPNTFLAHRLIWLARKEGQQDEVVEALFRAYFSDGQDIGGPQTLIKIGAACGIPMVRLQKYFAGSEGCEETKTELQQAVDGNITMVPHFVMNRDYWISGADTVETFSNAFKVAVQASVS